MLVFRLSWVQSESACRAICLYHPIQPGFVQGRPCLTSLISFYGKASHIADEGKAVDAIYLHFRKASDICLSQPSSGGTVCAQLRWARSSLGKKTAWMTKPRVVVGGVAFSWKTVTSSPGLSFGASHI